MSQKKRCSVYKGFTKLTRGVLKTNKQTNGKRFKKGKILIFKFVPGHDLLTFLGRVNIFS